MEAAGRAQQDIQAGGEARLGGDPGGRVGDARRPTQAHELAGVLVEKHRGALPAQAQRHELARAGVQVEARAAHDLLLAAGVGAGAHGHHAGRSHPAGQRRVRQEAVLEGVAVALGEERRLLSEDLPREVACRGTRAVRRDEGPEGTEVERAGRVASQHAPGRIAAGAVAYCAFFEGHQAPAAGALLGAHVLPVARAAQPLEGPAHRAASHRVERGQGLRAGSLRRSEVPGRERRLGGVVQRCAAPGTLLRAFPAPGQQ